MKTLTLAGFISTLLVGILIMVLIGKTFQLPKILLMSLLLMEAEFELLILRILHGLIK